MKSEQIDFETILPLCDQMIVEGRHEKAVEEIQRVQLHPLAGEIAEYSILLM